MPRSVGAHNSRIAPQLQKKLTPKEARFVAAYVGEAAGNGAKAAVLAGYATGSARITASRLLTKAHIKAALANVRDQKANEAVAADIIVRAKVMTGDEALERLSLYARSDISVFLAENDPIRQLPPDVRCTVKAIRPNRYGRSIELYDGLRATELLAKAGGKLKDIVAVESLEDLIAKSLQAVPA